MQLQMLDHRMFALFILLIGLMWLGTVLQDAREWYRCGYCGTTTGEHGDKCPAKKD